MAGRRQPARERALVPALVAMALVVSIISSLGAPLIPEIARELDVGLPSAQWSLTATMLVGAVASPVVGRIGDGPYRRTVLVACLAAVTAGGLLAASAGSLGALVAGRALQGLGLALLPLLMAVARDHLDVDRARRTIATLSVAGAIGLGLGYPVTGLIADRLDVGAAFAVGAVGSALALAAGWWTVPRTPASSAPVAVDLPGALLVGAGLVALLLGVERGAADGWATPGTLGLLVVGGVVLAAWARWQLVAASPLVELRQLRHRGVLTANVTSLLLGTATYAVLSLTTQVVQVGPELGVGVFVAGLLLVPFSVTSALGSALLGPLGRRAGEQASIPLGALMFVLGALLVPVLGASLGAAFATMALAGLGLGLTFAAMPALVVAGVPPAQTSSAMSLYQVTRYVGFATGSALAATLLRAFADDGAITNGTFSSAYVVTALVAATAAVVAWALGRPRSSRRRRDEHAHDRLVDARATTSP